MAPFTHMKIIYLAAYKAFHPKWNIVYQDINGLRDIPGDMLEVDLTPYDVIIATPPCNYYSRANYRREISEYSQKTKHLLPSIINKLITIDKPWIVENVRSPNIFKSIGILDLPVFVYYFGRHTYWTNVPFNPIGLPQFNEYELSICEKLPNGKWHKTGQKLKKNMNNMSSENRQGGENVNVVIEYWLEIVSNNIDS